jgi:hypothetical protein
LTISSAKSWLVIDNPNIFHTNVKPTILRQDSVTGNLHLDDDSSRKLLLDTDPAFQKKVVEVIQGIFPQTRLYKGQAAQGELLQLYAEFNLRLLSQSDSSSPTSSIAGLQTTITLTASSATGDIIDKIVTQGDGLPEKDSYWSLASGWQEIAAKSLTSAFSVLGKSLCANDVIKDYLKKLAEQRALPAGLSVTVHFDDSGSLLPNGRLDAGETARLVVELSSQGSGTAYGVALQGSSEDSQVTVSGNGIVGDIPTGQKQEAVLQVSGGLGLASGLIKLRIDAAEKRGYGARPVLLEVAGEQLILPHLEIVDVTLNDRSGRAQGDGDGQPANGETIEAVVRVRNAGPGDASGVSVVMASPKVASEIVEPKVVLPRIQADRVEEARLLFRLPLTLEAAEIPLAFQAVEARGSQVAAAAKEQSWKIRVKRPGIELAYRLYDGGSAGSAGNRDGKVSNGERIEVMVTPNNRGNLPARGVRISVASADSRLVPQPATLDVGDLPAQSEGPAQRFLIEVPRDFGQGRSKGDLAFDLTVSQADFLAHIERIALGFQALRPDLSLEADTPASVPRGSSGEVVLRCRNVGALRAEDVVIGLTSETPGVDLLDERGVPVHSRNIVFGALDPGAMAPQPSLGINVRRNAALGPAAVRITVSHKDFPSLSRTFSIDVNEEPAAVIPATQPVETVSRLVTTPAGLPASISFLGNTPGQHLLNEAIVLRFEVQSSSDPADVRLSQNDRMIPLEGARRSTSAAGGLQAVQYEMPIQLDVGENRLTVVAVTRQGLRNERLLTLIRDREVGRLWVVAIGVSKYQDSTIQRLGYADADAQAVAGYFRDTFGLPDSQVFLRINEQATLRDVKSILGTQLVAKANDPKDTVILYFAGHGMKERVPGSLDPDGLSKYFLPYDASRSDLYSSALEMDEVTNILRRLVPERVVVILDSCFSGAAGGRSPFDPKAQGERALISGEFLDRMAHIGKGRVVITASGPDESAQESPDLGHGVFTHYLIEGLRGAADSNGDGDIDVHEIYGYLSQKVAKATDGHQNPKLKEPDLVGQILIGRGTVRTVKPKR